MGALYPSWIEIPVTNLERALAFYRAVFGLTNTPLYDEPNMRIAVLLPSEKGARVPGVSLVQSPRHRPGDGAVLNFHMDTHAAFAEAMAVALRSGGQQLGDLVEEDDGVRYCMLRDCEGNPIALSSYEPLAS
jgi:predicted enzyme related to lactoylglutathione lyase